MDATPNLTRALMVLVALDSRKSQGRMDDAAELALRQAEEALTSVNSHRLLAAFRAWKARAGQQFLPAFDPTGGPVRVDPRETSQRDWQIAPRIPPQQHKARPTDPLLGSIGSPSAAAADAAHGSEPDPLDADDADEVDEDEVEAVVGAAARRSRPR
jgi:hypothetical protein